MNWTKSNPPPGVTFTHMVASADGAKMFAFDSSFYSDNYLYRSDDYGVSWVAAGSIPSGVGLYNLANAEIAASADCTKLFLISDSEYSGGIFISVDFGVTFTAVANPASLNGRHGRKFIACSQDGTRIVTVDAFGDVVYLSQDAGATWSVAFSIFDPVNPNYGVGDDSGTYETCTISNDGVNIAVGSRQGVLCSNDSGVSWSNTLPIPTIKVVSSANGVKLVAGADGGVYRSQDAGASWVHISVKNPVVYGLRFLQAIAMSADGSKLTIQLSDYLLLSNDFGNTFTTTERDNVPSDFGIDPKVWRFVKITADGTLRICCSVNRIDPDTSIDTIYIGAGDITYFWTGKVACEER